MEIAVIGLTAAIASLLTFFSGFGLGTILTPVFAIFFPVEVAIALTGVVHFLNNLFKVALTWKNISWNVALKFGVPAIVGAFLGAQLLLLIPDTAELYAYTIGEKRFAVTPVKLIVAVLMVVFALFEVVPYLKNLQFSANKIYAGGLVSGFFGGLSGHQGALRSAFLLRTGLTKEAFIATGIVIACFVDITRLSVYYSRFDKTDLRENLLLLGVAVLCAFTGAYAGSKLLKKVTMGFIQWTVTVLLILLALALGAGLI